MRACVCVWVINSTRANFVGKCVQWFTQIVMNLFNQYFVICGIVDLFTYLGIYVFAYLRVCSWILCDSFWTIQSTNTSIMLELFLFGSMFDLLMDQTITKSIDSSNLHSINQTMITHTHTHRHCSMHSAMVHVLLAKLINNGPWAHEKVNSLFSSFQHRNIIELIHFISCRS